MEEWGVKNSGKKLADKLYGCPDLFLRRFRSYHMFVITQHCMATNWTRLTSTYNKYIYKAELLQLNQTQFPSMGIFVSKEIGNHKN